jgi:hypothetical protein
MPKYWLPELQLGLNPWEQVATSGNTQLALQLSQHLGDALNYTESLS